jgi:hypothetical protein
MKTAAMAVDLRFVPAVLLRLRIIRCLLKISEFFVRYRFGVNAGSFGQITTDVQIIIEHLLNTSRHLPLSGPSYRLCPSR